MAFLGPGFPYKGQFSDQTGTWSAENPRPQKTSMFSDARLKLIAETLANVGIVFFGSTVVPTIVGQEKSWDGPSFYVRKELKLNGQVCQEHRDKLR